MLVVDICSSNSCSSTVAATMKEGFLGFLDFLGFSLTSQTETEILEVHKAFRNMDGDLFLLKNGAGDVMPGILGGHSCKHLILDIQSQNAVAVVGHGLAVLSDAMRYKGALVLAQCRSVRWIGKNENAGKLDQDRDQGTDEYHGNHATSTGSVAAA
jgi:hypothetical protein